MATQSSRGRLLSGLAVSIAAVAAVTALIYGLRGVMPVAGAGILYLVPVLIASIRWGVGLGVATAIASGAAFNWFHIPTTGRWTIADEQNWVALGAFLVVAVVTSGLANASRERAQEAERRRREADLTAEMARVLLSGPNVDDSLRAVGRRIAEAFELRSVELTASWRDSDPDGRALPIVVSGDRAGTLVIPRGAPVDVIETIERRVLPALETLLAAACQRDELEAQVIEADALRRSDVVKTAILRSVSHDLRSPLTAITAAAGGLASPTLDAAARAELVSIIGAESDRLTRLVDNLLDLSRIQSGDVKPRRRLCTAEELIRDAVTSVGAPERVLEVECDQRLPPISVDGGQVERALANVIENALRYAGDAPVSVRAFAVGARVVIQISDGGPGISGSERRRVFEPFYRSADRREGGSGLGLAIARGFAEANGGELRLGPERDRGTTFAFYLPAAREPAAVAGR
jgi:two-component system sensor histidine kinase KdpD